VYELVVGKQAKKEYSHLEQTNPPEREVGSLSVPLT